MKNSEKPALHEVILGEMEGNLSLDEFSVLGRILRKGRMPNKKVAIEVFNRLHALSCDPSRNSLMAVAAHQIAREIWVNFSEDQVEPTKTDTPSTPCASGLVQGIRS